jgi:hypothetical protein
MFGWTGKGSRAAWPIRASYLRKLAAVIGDVVKHRLGELEEESGAMREYISGSR